MKAYRELKANLVFFSHFSVVEYSAAADSLVTAWEQAKVRVGTKDLRIAAIALVNGATLLTRNARDFARVPGLLFEDWSV